MLTYLSLHVNQLKRKPFLLISIILVPIIIFKLWVPFLSDSLATTTIPIGWVDKDKTSFSSVIKERLSHQSRIRVEEMTEDKVKKAVQRGELEAAFIIKDGFEASIKKANIKNQIIWIRTNNASIDTFVKEKLAAEIMRLALNSKAANTVQGFGETIEWQQAFDYSDSYFEPTPLFQMAYHKSGEGDISNQEQIGNLGEKGIFGFILFYLWLLFALKIMGIYQDRNQGLITRIELISTNKMGYYLTNFFISWLLLLGLLLLLLVEVRFIFHIEELTLWGIWTGVIFTIVSVITVSLNMFLRSSKSFLSLVTVYLLCSYVISSVFPLITLPWLKQISWAFPHIWLYQGTPW